MVIDYQKGSTTANVLIGFDAKSVTELFNANSEDFGDITSLVASNPNIFLFGYGSPRNMIQMVHTYGAQGKSGGGASTFNIKFIDPEISFENNFLKHSTMQGQAISLFAKDPASLTSKYDFMGTPYGKWWEDAYGEKYEEAIKEDKDALEKQKVAWGNDINGQTQWSGRDLYLTGNEPQEPTGGMAPDGTYQEVINFSEWKAWKDAGSPPASKVTVFWSQPAPLTYSSDDPGGGLNNAPWRYYHKAMAFSPTKHEELEAETTAELREAIKSQQNMLGTGATTKIFIAYGMGYDFRSWAGPFITTMMDATNEYDAKGVRSLAIQLVANIGSLGSGAREGRMSANFGKKARVKHEVSVLDFNAFGQGTLKQKSSAEVAEVVGLYQAKYGDSYAAAWEQAQTTKGKKGSWFLGLGATDDHIRPYRYMTDHVPGDIHAILAAALTKYVTATVSQNDVPAGNVVVLMPDMTKGLESSQKKCLTDVLTSNGVREMNEGRLWQDMGASLYNREEVDTGNEIKAAKGISAQMSGDVNLTTVWGFQVLKKMLESLGFEFVVSRRQGNGAEFSEGNTQKFIEGLSFSAYKEFDPYDDLGWDNKNTQWSDSLLHFFGQTPGKEGNAAQSSKKFDVVITNRYDENFEETLYRVLQDISDNSKITFTPSLVWEQDITILKMMKDYGVIETDQQPAVLVGDKRLIDTFVYGGIEFQNVFKQAAATEKFLEHIHPSDIERFSWSAEGVATMNNAGIPLSQGSMSHGNGVFPYCQTVFAKLYQPGYGAFDKLFHPHSQEEQYEDPEKLVAAGLPIFRSGKKNSNILSMKADLKPYYFAGLFTNFLADRGRAQVAGSGKLVSNSATKQRNVDVVQKDGLSPKEREALTKIFRGGSPATNEALHTLNSMTQEEFGFEIKTEDDYRDFMNLMLGITSGDSTTLVGPDGLAEPNPLSVVIPSDGPRNSFLAVKDMVDFVSQQTISATIKTLPYFKLSGIQSLARPVIMDIREVQVANTPYTDRYSAKEATAFSTRIYSGFWNLFGFKHTITTKEAFSEFTLYKQPGATDPNYGNIGELSDEMEAGSIEASLESGQTFTVTQVATAATEGGSTVDNLLDNIQGKDNPPEQNLGGMNEEGGG